MYSDHCQPVPAPVSRRVGRVEAVQHEALIARHGRRLLQCGCLPGVWLAAGSGRRHQSVLKRGAGRPRFGYRARRYRRKTATQPTGAAREPSGLQQFLEVLVAGDVDALVGNFGEVDAVAGAGVALDGGLDARGGDTGSGNGVYLAEVTEEGVDIAGHKDFEELL